MDRHKSDKVYVETHALNAWEFLPPGIREDAFGLAELLAGTPPETWPERIRPWRPKDDVYALRMWVGPREVFAFIIPKGNRIHIDAVIGRDTIERIRGQKVTEFA